VVADLTRQSGRYNVSLGAVIMISGAGAAVRTFATGFIVEFFGFASGFRALTGVAVAGMALVGLRFHETVEATR
jgi:hypothetical protein